MRIHQWSAAVSGIDGSIRLNKDPRIVFGQLPRNGADDAHRDGIIHAEWATKGQYELALFQIRGIAEGQALETGGFNLQQSQIELAIHPDQLSIKHRIWSVRRASNFDADRPSALDDVRVRHHISLIRYDDAAAGAVFLRKHTGSCML